VKEEEDGDEEEEDKSYDKSCSSLLGMVDQG
jgi:hypothetical protein